MLTEKENEKLHQFLMGLNKEYNAIRSHILNMEPLHTLNKAHALIIKENKQQSVVFDRTPSLEGATFVAKKQQNQGYSKGAEKDVKSFCKHCEKTRHEEDKCFKVIGYPEW